MCLYELKSEKRINSKLIEDLETIFPLTSKSSNKSLHLAYCGSQVFVGKGQEGGEGPNHGNEQASYCQVHHDVVEIILPTRWSWGIRKGLSDVMLLVSRGIGMKKSSGNSRLREFALILFW